MKQKISGILLAAFVLSAACALGQTVGAAGSYAIVEASSLRKRPQDSWARSIAFKDQIVAAESRQAQRLDRRMYLPLELKNAGTVWIREDLYEPFAALPADMEFAFGGTVDQFNRRYYVILDAAYQIEPLPTQEERWTDALANPPAPAAGEQEDAYLAETGDLPVPEADMDETAEPLDGEQSWEDALAGIGQDMEEVPAEVETETVEMAEVDAQEDEAFVFDDIPEMAEVEEVPEAPEAVVAETESVDGAAAEEDFLAEAFADAFEALENSGEETLAEAKEAVEELEASVDAATDEVMAEDGWVEEEALQTEPADEAVLPPEMDFPDDFGEVTAETEAEEVDIPALPDEGLEAETEPLVVAEAMSEKEVWQPGEEDVAEMLSEPLTAVPTADESYHVAPMDEEAPIALVPLVSLEPTKAELAAQEERRREAERQAKIEAKRQREEEARRAKAEAAARKKAEAEARAELERARKEAEAARRAEEKRLREEEARALAAMEAREAQEREAFAQAAAREALQKERDELAAQVEAERAELAERSRMAQEVIAAEVAAREEAERAAREDAERQAALRAEKEQLEADLAAMAERQAEVEARLAEEQAAREEAERIAAEEAARAEELAAQERAAAAELAAAQSAAEEQAEAERAARQAAKKAKKEAARARAAAEREAAAAQSAAEALAAEREALAAVAAEQEAVDALAAEQEALEILEETVEVVAEPEVPAAPAPADVPDWMKPVVF